MKPVPVRDIWTLNNFLKLYYIKCKRKNQTLLTSQSNLVLDKQIWILTFCVSEKHKYSKNFRIHFNENVEKKYFFLVGINLKRQTIWLVRFLYSSS
jgi:hypothetical protein